MSLEVEGRGGRSESGRRGRRPLAPRGKRALRIGSEERLLLEAPLDELVSPLGSVARRRRPGGDEGFVSGTARSDRVLEESRESEPVLAEVEGILFGPGRGVEGEGVGGDRRSEGSVKG